MLLPTVSDNQYATATGDRLHKHTQRGRSVQQTGGWLSQGRSQAYQATQTAYQKFTEEGQKRMLGWGQIVSPRTTQP